MQGDVIGEQVAARWGLAAHTAPFEMAALGKKTPRDQLCSRVQTALCPRTHGVPQFGGAESVPEGYDPLPSPPSSLLTSFLPIPKGNDSWGKILEYFNKEETDGSHLAG